MVCVYHYWYRISTSLALHHQIKSTKFGAVHQLGAPPPPRFHPGNSPEYEKFERKNREIRNNAERCLKSLVEKIVVKEKCVEGGVKQSVSNGCVNAVMIKRSHRMTERRCGNC